MTHKPVKPCCPRFQQIGTDLALLLQENDALKRQLQEIRHELEILKEEYAALHEDFSHALQCEFEDECPKNRQTVHFRNQKN